MQVKNITVAKIERDIYSLVENGEKTIEVRDEEIKTPFVCFVDSVTGEYLGTYKINGVVYFSTLSEYSKRDIWYEIISKIASIPVDKTKELFNNTFVKQDILYFHRLGEKLDIMSELFPRFDNEEKEQK